MVSTFNNYSTSLFRIVKISNIILIIDSQFWYLWITKQYTYLYIYRPFHIISYVTNNQRMEYTTDEYKRSIEKVFTTSDGNKYIQ